MKSSVCRIARCFIICFVLSSGVRPLLADEGMYPLSEIHKLDLKSKGLKVSPKDIYNPGGVGLIDAIVQLDGCTGSFVSPDGLIITNHHCAFGAVQAASTPEHDYITDGFLARTRAEELPARGFTVRIVDSYRDVSKDVLSAVNDTMDVASRAKAISKRIREIVTDTETKNSGKRAEVAEMFAGKSYMLFIYTYLKDVRAVYVPPRSIGEFGGENDNWMWPRHTGDFSFVRAYVAPDGSPAEYSTGNVPYHPRKYLKIAPQGVDEGNPVFMLGYPGRTFRHRPSHYLAFEQDVRLPYVAKLYEWQIETMEGMSKTDPAVAIKLSGRTKSLANTMKNYQGKLKGMRQLNLVDKKREEERALQDFVEEDPVRKEKYGSVLEEIGRIYQEMREQSDREMILDYLRSSSTMLNFGYVVYEAARELKKPDLERESPYTERNFPRLKESMLLSLRNYHRPADSTFLREMLIRANRLPESLRIAAIDSLIGTGDLDSAIGHILSRAYSHAQLTDSAALMTALLKSSDELDRMNEPFIQLAKALFPTYQQLRETRQGRDGAMNKLLTLFVDAKQEFLRKDFIPDANSTLRLTFGKIEGYSPADALYASPITTVRGIVEKTTGEEPYNTPQKLIELHRAREFGRFVHKKLNDVPVGLLYNLDTTGGNSGSPLLNARGEVVGVNFDRVFEATINDYAWNQTYSRSIAVDIRYVLWVLEKFAGAEHLLKEIGIKSNAQ